MLTVKVNKPDMKIPQSYVTTTYQVDSSWKSGHGDTSNELVEIVTFQCGHNGPWHIEPLPRGCQTEIYVENPSGKTVMAYKAPPKRKGVKGGTAECAADAIFKQPEDSGAAE